MAHVLERCLKTLSGGELMCYNSCRWARGHSGECYKPRGVPYPCEDYTEEELDDKELKQSALEAAREDAWD